MDFIIAGITICVVCIILAVYRTIDKNNQSRASLKHFTEKLQKEIGQYVDERSQVLKNAAVELDVRQKVEAQLINRIQDIEKQLGKKAGEVEALFDRVAQYDKAIGDLLEMTRKADENLQLLKGEESFLDSLSKRIHSSNSKMDDVDNRVSKILSDFADKNSAQINQLWSAATKEAEKVSLQLHNELVQSSDSVKEFTHYLNELEQKRDAIEEQLLKSAKLKLDSLVNQSVKEFSEFSTQAQNQIASVKDEYKNQVKGYKEETQKIEEEYRSTLNKSAETLRKHLQLSEKTVDSIKVSTDGLVQKANEVESVITQIRRYDKDIQTLTKLSNEVQDNLSQLRNGAGFVESTAKRLKNAESVIDKLESRIPTIEENIKEDNRKALNLLCLDVKNSIETSATRFQSDFSLAQEQLGEFTRLMGDFEKRKEDLFATAKVELDDTIKNIVSQANLDLNTLSSNFKSDVKRYSSSMGSEMQQRFDHLQNEYKEIEKAVRALASQATNDTAKGVKEINDLAKESLKSLQKESGASIESSNNTFTLIKERLETIQNEFEQSASQTNSRLKEQRNEAEDLLSKCKAILMDLGEKSQQIDHIYVKLNDYSDQMQRLGKLSKESRETLSLLEQRKHFVDKLDGKIKSTQKIITHLESQLPRLHDDFSKENESRCSSLLEQMTSRAHNIVSGIKGELGEVSKQVGEFSVHVGMLQNRRDKMAQTLFDDVNNKIDLKAKEVESVMAAQLEAQRDECSSDLKNEISRNLAEFQKQINKNVVVFKSQFETITSDLKALAQSVVNDSKEVDSHLDEKYSSIRVGIEQLSKGYQDSADRNTKRFEDQRIASERVLSKLESMVNQLSSREEEIDSIYGRLTEVDQRMDRLSSLGKEASTHLEELAGKNRFIQNLAKMINKEEAKLNEIEKRIPHLEEGFTARNKEQLKQIYTVATQESKEQFKQIEGELGKVRSEVLAFSSEMKNYEQQQRKSAKENLELFNADVAKSIQKNQQQQDSLMKEYKLQVAQLQKQLEKDSDELANKVNGLSNQIQIRLKESENTLGAQLSSFKKKADEIEGRYQNNMNAMIDRTRELDDEIFATLRLEVEKKASNLEKELSNGIEGVRTRLKGSNEELVKMFGDMRSEIALQKQTSKKQIEELHNSVNQEMKNFENEMKQRVQQLTAQSNQTREDFESQMMAMQTKSKQVLDASKKQVEGQIQSIQSNMDKTIASITEEMNKLSSHALKEQNRVQNEINQKSSQLELKATTRLEKVEQRLIDFETTLWSKRNNIDQIPLEMDELSKSLRHYMQEEADGIRRDFVRFSKELEEQREIEKKQAASLFGDFRKSMSIIEADIEKIKSEASQNVSKKLGLLEDDFFSDIKTRTEQINEKIEDWQKRIGRTMDQVVADAKKDRTRIEERYNSELNGVAKNAVKAFDERLKAQGSVFNEKIILQQKAYDDKYASFVSQIDSNQGVIDSMIKKTQDDMQSWQQQIAKDFKEKKALVLSDISEMKSSALESINKIRDNFSLQKNKLEETHKSYINDIESHIKDLGVRINQMGQQLEQKGVELDSQIVASDEQLRKNVAQTRKELMELQKNLEQRIAEAMGSLHGETAQINSQIKDFLAQSKLFDKADTRRQELKDEIDRLVLQIQSCENRQQELKRTDAEFDRIQKIELDLSTKLKAIGAQRNKIEAIDRDFNRLLEISVNTDERIKDLQDRSDVVQAMEMRLRNLKELEDEVSEKEKRLEKKKEVYEDINKGVDQNHQEIVRLENRFIEVEKGFDVFIEDLKKANDLISKLSNKKHDAEAAYKMLEQFDKKLTSIETHMDRMDKKSEWIANTETRLKSLYDESENQLKLLGAVMKANGKDVKAGSSNSQMVIALYKRGMSTQDIVKTTGLSLGDVQLILEMASRKK